uniref:Tripartite motif-containing protein 16-like n=1 Tax=Cyprinodon variegatus TaxID=28743 RepID=A0A3Q2E3U1_CYPVA
MKSANKPAIKTFSCSICLDLLKDPVTIPCGHNYCMNCIKSHWDKEDQVGIQSCPQCRETFIPRPFLKKNNLVAAVVEQIKKTGLQAAPADHCYIGAEDVACDICTKGKVKATMSCLVCLASYCEKHLQSHRESAPLKKHKLVEPSKNLQENICSHHDEVMKMFCRDDQKCICYLCSVEEHKGHEIVSIAAEKTKRQSELEERRGIIQQRVQDREKDVKLLQQEVKAINQLADKTVEESKKIFNQLIHFIQKRSSDVKQQIRSQQEAVVSPLKELQEKLQQEITELKRKDVVLEQLTNTEDHNQFLRSYLSLSDFSESAPSHSINVCPLRSWQDVTAAVSDGTEFLEYSLQITLDPNTANRQLSLSEGNRKVNRIEQPQSYSSHPNRFTDFWQVLSIESLHGCCYWEVEWRGDIDVAVAYKNISRVGEGDECLFGFNEKSWALNCNQGNYTFGHNNIWTPISGPGSSRVGVDLDHRAGVLSFYRVSETRTLLHRVQTKFTQPLHAGVWVGTGSSAEFCKPK